MSLQTPFRVIEKGDGLHVKAGPIADGEHDTAWFALECLSAGEVREPNMRGWLEVDVAPGVSFEELRQYLGSVGCSE